MLPFPIFFRRKVLQNTAKDNVICDKAIAKSYFMGVLLSGNKLLVLHIICFNHSYPLQVLFDPLFTLLSVLGRH